MKKSTQSPRSCSTEGAHVMEMGREGSSTWRSTFLMLMFLFTLGNFLASRSQMLMKPPCTITALDTNSNHVFVSQFQTQQHVSMSQSQTQIPGVHVTVTNTATMSLCHTPKHSNHVLCHITSYVPRASWQACMAPVQGSQTC